MRMIAAASAREILTGLHEVMASRATAQAKLNKVVQIIGEALASEVCSIYLRREGVLELFATRGLNQEAVHVTKLAMGEGLVGTIAEQIATLNLDEATSHPDFAYSSTALPACPSSARKMQWACSASSMRSPDGMKKSKSRHYKQLQWFYRNLSQMQA